MICLIRIEAYPEIGTGHFVRCKIIADFFSARGINCLFVVSSRSKNIVESRNVQYRIIDENDELNGILTIGNEFKEDKLVLTDSDKEIFYSKEYQTGIINEGFFLATITMRNDCHFYSNIVLNQNIIALTQQYKHSDYSELLLGPQYIIFNENFRNIDTSQVEYNDTNSKPSILINFGGADRLNLTLSVFEQLLSISEEIEHVNIVVGGLYEPIEELTKCIKANAHVIKVNLFVNTNRMPEIMLESNFAITSGGLTVWELLYLKVPNLVISTSERERITAEALHLKNCIINKGHQVIGNEFAYDISRHLKNKKGLFNSIIKSEVRIDGKGINRFYDAVMNLLKIR